MYLYEDQFSQDHDFKQAVPVAQTLVIASTARCGSHMLGHALHKTGHFGFPLEYLNPPNLAEWQQRLQTNTPAETLLAIMRKRTSPNGVFAIKVHYEHLAHYGGFERVQAFFTVPRYVLLTRNDVLKQAVSHAMAEQTGVWISGMQAVNAEPQYNFKQINRCLKRAIADNASWRYTLAANGCQYIEMSFDEVKKNLPAAVMRVADLLNIKPEQEAIPAQPVTKKQANQLNQAWTARFVEEFDGNEALLDGIHGSLRQRLGKWLKNANAFPLKSRHIGAG